MTVDLTKLTNLAGALKDRTAEARRGGDQAKSWYRISNVQPDRAEVYLYDMIGDWGITAQDFVNDLKAINAPAVDIHINSEGGSVFDGVAIYTAIRQHPGTVTAYIDGLAASAASFIAMAAEQVVMAKNARMMIHMASGLVLGTADDMREMADLLDDLSTNIASIYADKAGGTAKTWLKAMKSGTGNGGTWYSAEDAVKAGLADAIDTPTTSTPARETAGASNTSTTETAARWDPKQFAEITKGVFQ